MRYLAFSLLCFCLTFALFQPPITAAQQPKQANPAPVPAPILSAKKIFIANGGGEDWPDGSSPFTGGPNRAYNQFYAAMKSWGRFELVDSPAAADLLFEIRFSLPPAELTVLNGDTIRCGRFDPLIRLEIRDTKSHALLWALTEHAHWAILQGNRDKNFDLGLEKLVTEIQRLVVLPQVPANATK